MRKILVLLLVFLFLAPCFAQDMVVRRRPVVAAGGGGGGEDIAFVQASTLGTIINDTSGTAGLGTQPVAGHFIAVIVSIFGPTTASSVTDNASNTYQLAVRSALAASFQRVEIWYAMNISTAASFTVTVNLAASGWANIAVLEYSGVATSAAADGTNTAVGSSTTPNSGAVAPSGYSLYIGAWTAEDANPALTAGTSWTQRQVDETLNFSSISVIDRIGNLGSIAANWTADNSHTWTAAVAAFKD